MKQFRQSRAFQTVMGELKRTEPGADYLFNLADPDHFEYWKLLFESHGITSEEFPQTHRVLEATRELHRQEGGPSPSNALRAPGPDGFTNSNALCGISAREGKCEALGYSTVIGGTRDTNLILQLIDADTHEVLASESTEDVGNGRLVQSFAEGAVGQAKKVKAVLNYSIVTSAGDPLCGAVQSDKVAGAREVPIVTQPASKPEHETLPNIMIALSRGLAGKDVDYWFHKGSYNDNTIVVPFVGSVPFESEIQELKPVDSLHLSMTVMRAEGGAKKLKPEALGELYRWFKRVEDPKKPELGKSVLSWNLPCDGDGVTAGKPIFFSKSPWCSDTVTVFHSLIGVKTKTIPDAFVWAFVIGDQTKHEDQKGIKYIKPIVYFWHCLAKGTQVSLRGGATRAIEDLEGGEEILVDNQGNFLPVRATTYARHTGEAVVVTCRDGAELTLSDSHVVITTNGPKGAKELTLEDTLVTLNGTTGLRGIKAVAFDDELVNLLLGTHDQQAGIPECGTTMFANGIQVGDHQVQTQYLQRSRTDPDLLLKRLDPAWHKDFRSAWARR